MNTDSITFKILSFIMIALILVTISIMSLSYIQLTPIVDKSQGEIYSEKLDVIVASLSRMEERLQRTGLVDAYIDDFKNSAIATLRNTYYKLGNSNIKLFILDGQGRFVMRPDDSSALPLDELHGHFQNGSVTRGEFNALLQGEPTWYVYRQFEPWGWTICYSVPDSVKYADLRQFTALLLVIMLSTIFVITAILSVIVARLVRPVSLLTTSAARISAGDLEQPITIERADEIGALAKSFDHMRNSLKDRMEQLNSEIVERRKAEDELRRLRNYLSNIIDSMPSILVGIDAEGKVTQWNKTAERSTGISAEMAYGHALHEVFPQMQEQMGNITQAINAREVKRIARRPHPSKSGTHYEDITFYPLVANGVEGAVIRIEDVTKEYELEMELNHSRKMDAIGQLAGGVAHDFNNMLGGILGAVQLLRNRQNDPDEKSLKYISMIERSSMRAADLTGKLLAFGRKGNITPVAVDIRAVIDDTVAFLSRTIDKRITLSVRAGATNTTLMGDNSALQNALLNIGINASHSMPDGGNIEIETRNVWLSRSFCSESTFDIGPGEYLQIEVRDSGCGIPQQNLDRIFEPFFTTKETGRGAGLGLASVYGTVKDHHGLITVHSTVDVGTGFSLFLPVSDANNLHQVSTQEAGVVQGSGRVLLVDDEEMIRSTGEQLLIEAGYNVLLAENGLEAVNIFRQQQGEIDLVIMDMVMPVMSGREAIRRLREIEPECSVIVASGYAEREQEGGSGDNDIQGFLQKPYRIATLSQLIAQVLEQRRSRVKAANMEQSNA
ncbi:MAG: response regulator [Gammaproteobacteria bacterium]|nr:response regulator [Gammaproteobacteria bacterium]